MSATETPRTKLTRQIRVLLGSNMVEVELDPEDYDTAIDLAIERIRQRTTGGVEESHIFFSLEPFVDEYTMPEEVQEVERLYRRGVGANSTGGTNFDPFEAAFSNIYLLQAGRTGGLATWDFFAQYQETLGRVFGSEINFIWEPSTHKLKIIRRPTAAEDVLVKCWMRKPEDIIITDDYTGPWVRDYSLAKAKQILGEARSKFPGGLVGPGGAVQLNGDQLKADAAAEMERLEAEVQNFVTSRDGMPFRIG